MNACSIYMCCYTTPGSISLLILNTTTWFNYTYLDDFEIYVRDINSIVFMVKAANDAHISLSETIYMHTRDSYEVVIGKLMLHFTFILHAYTGNLHDRLLRSLASSEPTLYT